MIVFFGSVASTKFNRFQPIKFKCHKINSIENQYFSYLSDSIFLKEKQKIDRCDRTHKINKYNLTKNNNNTTHIFLKNCPFFAFQSIKTTN